MKVVDSDNMNVMRITVRFREYFAGLLGRIYQMTVSKAMAYVRRPRVIFPHSKRGIIGNVSIGEGCVLRSGARIDGTGYVEIGEHCIISRDVNILSHDHTYWRGEVEDITGLHEIIQCKLHIGSNVYIGAEAVILPAAGEVGDNAVIGIRSVVTKPVGAGEIWAGNPARRVGGRYD